MKLYIVSGLPGSGKTHWANQQRQDLEKEGYKYYSELARYSADDYFTSEGRYNFNPKEIQTAHKECFKNVMLAMRDGVKYIFVDNTFTQNWEISPYIALAGVYFYDHEIVRLICDPTHSKENNEHNVPDKTIDSMYARMEKPLPFWNYYAKVVDWK